jgi:hypothetical protein
MAFSSAPRVCDRKTSVRPSAPGYQNAETRDTERLVSRTIGDCAGRLLNDEYRLPAFASKKVPCDVALPVLSTLLLGLYFGPDFETH